MVSENMSFVTHMGSFASFLGGLGGLLAFLADSKMPFGGASNSVPTKHHFWSLFGVPGRGEQNG